MNKHRFDKCKIKSQSSQCCKNKSKMRHSVSDLLITDRKWNQRCVSFVRIWTSGSETFHFLSVVTVFNPASSFLSTWVNSSWLTAQYLLSNRNFRLSERCVWATPPNPTTQDFHPRFLVPKPNQIPLYLSESLTTLFSWKKENGSMSACCQSLESLKDGKDVQPKEMRTCWLQSHIYSFN